MFDAADSPNPYFGSRHARLHLPNVTYHIIARTFQGAMLLTPSKELNDIIAGVIARAQELYQDVELYTHAFMSNHFHLMLRGPAHHVPAFVGFIKGEISRRWGPRIGWEDGMWRRRYESTALPRAEDEIRCLEYILGQGVKEGLVTEPEEWPGIHAAKQIFVGEVLEGTWPDGTGYSKAKHRAAATKAPKSVLRRDFTTKKSVTLAELPAWRGMNGATIRRELAAMRERIIQCGRRARAGRRAAGPSVVMRTPRSSRRKLSTRLRHRRSEFSELAPPSAS